MKDLYDSETVEHIHDLLRNINETRMKVEHAEQAKEKYAELVNSLIGRSIDDSIQCQRIAADALDLIKVIESLEICKAELAQWEDELISRYGFQRSGKGMKAAANLTLLGC